MKNAIRVAGLSRSQSLASGFARVATTVLRLLSPPLGFRTAGFLQYGGFRGTPGLIGRRETGHATLPSPGHVPEFG
jgi:hypothetical protein